MQVNCVADLKAAKRSTIKEFYNQVQRERRKEVSKGNFKRQIQTESECAIRSPHKPCVDYIANGVSRTVTLIRTNSSANSDF